LWCVLLDRNKEQRILRRKLPFQTTCPYPCTTTLEKKTTIRSCEQKWPNINTYDKDQKFEKD
jgi:hypothetical protein